METDKDLENNDKSQLERLSSEEDETIASTKIEVIYTAESSIRNPGRLIREMWTDTWKARELSWQLFVRDLKARYRQNFFGILWAIVPALTAGIGLAIANNSKVINFGETEMPYAAYVMISFTLWQTFLAAFNAPQTALMTGKTILSKIKVPPEALIVAQIWNALLDALIRAVFVAVLFVWFSIPVTPGILLAPFAFLLMLCFGIGLGLVLAPIGSLYHDIGKIMRFVQPGLLLITPVLYPVPGDGVFGMLVRLNPLTPLLTTTRDLLTGEVVMFPLEFLIVGVVSVILTFVALLGLRLAMPFVIERMSA